MDMDTPPSICKPDNDYDRNISSDVWMKFLTRQFEVRVSARLNVETLTLILKPQSVVLLGELYIEIKNTVLRPKFRFFSWLGII